MIHPRGWMTRAGAVLLAVLLLTLLVCVGCGAPLSRVAETTVTNGSNEVVTTGTSQRTTTTAKTNPWTEVKSSTSTIPATQPGADSSAGASTTGSAVTTGPSNSSSGGASPDYRWCSHQHQPGRHEHHANIDGDDGSGDYHDGSPTTTTAPPTTTTEAHDDHDRWRDGVGGHWAVRNQVLHHGATQGQAGRLRLLGRTGQHLIGYYTGVRLFDLLDEVGGLPAGKGLRITASDGFTCDYEASVSRPWPTAPTRCGTATARS